jgi:hypothetical protein
MKTHTITGNGTHALLIDLDNCPRQIEMLPQTLDGFSRIVACYGGVEPKVHLSLVPLLAAAINTGKLEIVGMEKRGKNAADFGIAFWAGRLMAEMPPETEFLILSQDSDLDHVVNMLRSAKRKVRRINGKTKKVKIANSPASSQGILSETDDISSDDLNVIEEYSRQVLHSGKPRPAKKTTLIKSVKSYFKNRKEIDPEKVLQGLVENGIIAINEKGRVTYSKADAVPQPPSVLSRHDEIPF